MTVKNVRDTEREVQFRRERWRAIAGVIACFLC